ncbi:MAG TPA: L-seryl-tRNA(Sec) selenium transferase [Gammaproteobacteria bacterium]
MEVPVVPPARASAADIPSVDRLLNGPAFAPLLERYGRTQTTAALRAHLDVLRASAREGSLEHAALADDAIAAAVEAALVDAAKPRLRRVFNLTGTVLHTNLGRAVLPQAAARALADAATEPVNLEFDLAAGRRGDRDALVESLLCELTGAEAATVVNNNAAAVLLMLAALASRREVVISRGELIEIGGSFRMPDIMRQANAKLVEVGTTNRTHLADYAQAIGPRTALLVKVHTSNYAITGFTASVSSAELKALAREHGLPVAVDLGSGSLVDLAAWGLPKEPTVSETVSAGADVVCFSGDKLLGGPQSGLLVGSADAIRKIKRHPLKRALRVDKLTLAALEAVLKLYRAPDRLAAELPTLRLLTRPAESMRAQAARLAPLVQRAVGETYEVAHGPMASQIGSGALPVERLPSYGLIVRPTKGRRGSLRRLEAALRALPRPVIGRIEDGALRLDLRCLDETDEAEFAAEWHMLGESGSHRS